MSRQSTSLAQLAADVAPRKVDAVEAEGLLARPALQNTLASLRCRMRERRAPPRNQMQLPREKAAAARRDGPVTILLEKRVCVHLPNKQLCHGVVFAPLPYFRRHRNKENIGAASAKYSRQREHAYHHAVGFGQRWRRVR